MNTVLYRRDDIHIIEGRSPTDEELEAECNLLGCMMSDLAIGLGDHQVNEHMTPMPFLGFGTPFHAAAYYAALALELAIGAAYPELVWTWVEHHPDAKCFGLKHLKELADHADEERLSRDVALLRSRAARLLARERALDTTPRTKH